MEDLVERDGATVGSSISDYSLHLLEGIASVASETTSVSLTSRLTDLGS